MISVEKPGSPSEILKHAGIKGMKWGVRKAVAPGIDRMGVRETFSNPKKVYRQYQSQTIIGKQMAARNVMTEHRKQVAKKAALGITATAAVVGSAFVAHKLYQSHQVKLAQLQRAENVAVQTDAVRDILAAVSGGNVEQIR